MYTHVTTLYELLDFFLNTINYQIFKLQFTLSRSVAIHGVPTRWSERPFPSPPTLLHILIYIWSFYNRQTTIQNNTIFGIQFKMIQAPKHAGHLESTTAFNTCTLCSAFSLISFTLTIYWQYAQLVDRTLHTPHLGLDGDDSNFVVGARMHLSDSSHLPTHRR